MSDVAALPAKKSPWAPALDRLRVWKKTLWRPWWAAMTAVFGLAANWDTVMQWTGATSLAIAALIPRLDGKTWLILWLVGTIGVLLEALYRVTKQRDSVLRKLRHKEKNQALSDFLSDRHDYAIHELLNKPPLVDDEASFREWDKRVHEWTQETIRAMRDHGCSKQTIRSVNSLGLFPMIPLHKNPGVTHAMSMLVERMQRIADVARSYGS